MMQAMQGFSFQRSHPQYRGARAAPRGAVAACIAVFAVAAHAQGPPAPPSPNPPASVITVRGTVARLLPNPRGDIDGLLLQDGTQVPLPPHLTEDLKAIVHPGDVVDVEGARRLGIPLVAATRVTNVATRASIVDRPPPPRLGQPGRPRVPGREPELQALSAQGRVQRLLYDRRGEINGVMLDSGTIVRFAPHAIEKPDALLQPGNVLRASGYGVVTSYGEVFEATSVGAPGAPPELLYAPPKGPQ